LFFHCSLLAWYITESSSKHLLRFERRTIYEPQLATGGIKQKSVAKACPDENRESGRPGMPKGAKNQN
jgi:hypothetical protein